VRYRSARARTLAPVFCDLTATIVQRPLGRVLGYLAFTFSLFLCPTSLALPPPFLVTASLSPSEQELRRQVIDIDSELAALDEANDE